MAPRGKSKDETLTFRGDFDGSGISKGIKRMGTDWSKEMRKVEKASEVTFRGTGRAVADYFKKSDRFQFKHNKLLKEAVKEQHLYADKIKEATKRALALRAVLKDKSLSKETRAGAEKGIRDSHADIKKLKKAHHAAKGQEKEIRGGHTSDKDEIREAWHDAAGEIKDIFDEAFISPFHSILRKDVPGALKGLTGGLGKMLKGGGNLLQHNMDKAKAAGGGGGAMTDVLGKLAGTMKTMGPILAVVGASVAAIVAILLDAEAAAKEFNKQILSTAGSSEFLHRNLKDADMAGADLEGTLKDIRDQATSLDNMDWGINKETHTAVLNAITAEGVSLKKLDDDFKRVGQSAEGAEGYAKDWGTTVQMSVAYSRAFGVSLQDVSQLQGEMMTEMGMNLGQVEKSFQYMTEGADEAGIATNKFFNIIRTFSADLTLFNIRMEDVTKTMIMLGKAMSPREAQKMLQSLSSMFKGKSLTDRTKDVIMGGGRVRKAMNEQQEGNVKNLAADVGITPKEMTKILKKDTKQLARWLATDGKNLNADQRKAVFEAARMEHKLDTGDTIDLASAIKDANPWTAKKIADAKVAAITGGKKIDQLTGINRIAAEQAADVGDELQDQIAKLEMSTATMKADLAEKLKTANGDSSKFTKEEQKMLAKLGVKIDDGTTFGKLDAASSEDFYNSLDKDQKDILENGKKEIDFQKEVAHNTQSAMDKLGVLVDFVMNQIYDIMSSIYDALLSVLGKLGLIDDASVKRQGMAKDIQKSGNADLINAWGKSHGDEFKFKDEIIKSLGGKMDNFLDQSAKDTKELQKSLAEETDPTKQEALQKKLAAITAKRQALTDKIVGKQTTEQQFDALQAAANNGLGDPKIVKAFQAMAQVRSLQKQQEGGGSVSTGDMEAAVKAQKEAFAEMSGSAESIDEYLKKSLGAFSPEDLKNVMPDVGKALQDQAPDLGKFAEKGASDNTLSVKVTKMLDGDQHDEQMGEMSDQGGTLDDIFKALRIRGIKIDKPFLGSAVKTVIQDATYDSFTDALYDYWVLTNTRGEQSWADWMKEGGLSGGAAVKGAGKWAKENPEGMSKIYTGGGATGATPSGDKMTGFATGGVIPRPAPGEIFVSAKPGERVTNGTGGQVITLRLKGDLGRIIDAHADDRISHGKQMSTRR